MSTTTTTGSKPQVPKGPAPKAPSQVPLNPERVPPLAGKYAKMLGKDCEEITVKYTATGVNVTFTVNVDGKDTQMSLAELKAHKKKDVKVPSEDLFRIFRNKYELRLNKELKKATFDAATATHKEMGDKIQAFIESLAFKERRALLMTQKQFEKNYPNGYTQE